MQSTVHEERQKARHQLAPFFGNDRRADLFIKLFWKNKLTSINENADDILKPENQLELSFMEAAKYTDGSKSKAQAATGLSMNARDIHYQFTDFIVNTALFHRALDAVTGVGAITQTELIAKIGTWLGSGNRAPTGDTTILGIADADVHLNAAGNADNAFTRINLLAAAKRTRQFTVGAAGATTSGAEVHNLNFFERMALLGAALNMTDSTVATVSAASANVFSTIFTTHLLVQLVNTLYTDVISALVTAFASTYTLDPTKEAAVKADLRASLTAYFTTPVNFKLDHATDLVDQVHAIAAVVQQKITASVKSAMDNLFAKYPPAYTGIKTGSDEEMAAKQIFWDKVVREWSSLDNGVRDFYNEFITITPIGSSVRVDPSTLSTADVTKYRVNITKTNQGEPCPNFWKIIPKVNTQVKNIWYTSASNISYVDISRITGADTPKARAEVLRDLYCGVFRNQVGAATVGINNSNVMRLFTGLPTTWNRNAEIFLVNVRELIYKLVLDMKHIEDVEVPEDEEIIGMGDREIWHRVKDGNSFKFVHTNKTTGEQTAYGQNDPAYQNIMHNSFSCYSTLLNLKGDECDEYMYQCLLNNDAKGVDRCIAYWDKSKDKFKHMKDEIGKMHPMVAVKTLQKFGFQMKESYDSEAGRRLRKAESVNDWVNRHLSKGGIKDTKGTDQQKLIQDNTDLMNYLKLVVQYINSNPEILNADYSGATVETKGVPELSDFQKKMGITMRRTPFSYKSKAEIDQQRMYDKIRVDYGNMSKARYGVVPTTGFPAWSSYFGSALGFQTGGANTFLKRVSQGKVTGAVALGNIIDGLVANLRRSGKTIDDVTIKKIEDQKAALLATENNLLKTEMYLEEYKNIIDLFHQYDQQVVKMSDIEKMVQHHHKASTKMYQGEKYLVDIFNSLAQLVEDKKDSKSMALNP